MDLACWDDGLWFGVRGFFNWLERKSYKMHIRVLLSKYRAYTPCETCKGARLKVDALWWRLGNLDNAEQGLNGAACFVPQGTRPRTYIKNAIGRQHHLRVMLYYQ